MPSPSDLSTDSVANDAEVATRQRWMAVLARADLSSLQSAWDGLDAPGSFQVLRAPERGLVLTRGRAGGSGRPFNLGEVSVTRCSVRAEAGHIGHAYCLGSVPEKAELAARLDALLQDPDRQDALLAQVIEPLAADQSAKKDLAARKAAATKVDFFTMVRGS